LARKYAAISSETERASSFVDVWKTCAAVTRNDIGQGAGRKKEKSLPK
jgi:hypothetical protein